MWIGIGSSVLLAVATYGAVVWRVGRLERDVKDHDAEDKKIAAKVDLHAEEITRQRERTHALVNDIQRISGAQQVSTTEFKEDLRLFKTDIMRAIDDLRDDMKPSPRRRR